MNVLGESNLKIKNGRIVKVGNDNATDEPFSNGGHEEGPPVGNM